ncbi:hypothetical protein WR51_29910 (plasmid) [Bacillus cereus]|nr:hypothetical protein WR47_28760 [Bacillus cereus]ANC17133.1 hypothetical protein WR51_29910 [Bacillus cereus]
MRKIGYVRVSSVDQNPKRQLQQMEEIGVDIIYQEKVSVAIQDRLELQNILGNLEEGDIIYIGRYTI